MKLLHCPLTRAFRVNAGLRLAHLYVLLSASALTQSSASISITNRLDHGSFFVGQVLAPGAVIVASDCSGVEAGAGRIWLDEIEMQQQGGSWVNSENVSPQQNLWVTLYAVRAQMAYYQQHTT